MQFIKTTQTENGFVNSYIIYIQLNEKTEIDLNGRYLFISDLWAHESIRENKSAILQHYLRHLNTDELITVKYLYWERPKYCNKLSFAEVIRYSDGTIKIKKIQRKEKMANKGDI